LQPDTTISTGALRRATLVSLTITLLLALLLIRVLVIQTADFERYQKKVVEQLTTESVINAKRGNIYDSNGVLLATNVTAYRIFISPRSIQKLDTIYGLAPGTTAKNIAAGLSEILGKYGVTYEQVLKQTTYTHYLDRTIARNVDEETTQKIRGFIDQCRYHDQIYAEAISTRYYPQESLASHLIGFTGSDGVGLYGLEYEYNEQLAGTPGKYITARDSHGNEMPYEYESYIPARDGYNLITTIDSYVQAVLEEQLEITLTESGAKNRACGIVMEVHTGAIVAMATYPGFDLNNPWELNEYSQKKLDASGYTPGSDEYIKLSRDLLLETWKNKAITEIYMPGSTFKIMTVAMALQEKEVTMEDRFFCSGSLNVLGTTIRCHKVTGHGSLDLTGGLQHSCNVTMMTLGARIGTERFYNYVKQFGYLEKTGIDLPGEDAGIFYSPTDFREIDLAVSSFGQNFKISPLQQICAVAAVANGGYLVTPYVVERITDNEGNVVFQQDTRIKRQVVNSEVCAVISEILEGGVSGDGGGKNAYVAGYRVAAKTGTSEKVGDNRDLRISSCVAYAPADDPQYTIIIMVDEPSIGSAYGSIVAAPYIGNVLREILPYLGVEAVYSERELANMSVQVPNFVHWSRALAENYARSLDIEIEIRGEGNYIVKQTPGAGALMEQSLGKVILYAGSDIPERTVRVPDVTGRTAAAANGMIINAGLNIRIEGTRNYLSGTGAVVVSQSPAAGELVPEGTVVTVTFRYLDETDN
jgi:stage V sporulation protein D (sporulation-specific penicillin-binding protein)